MSDAGSAHSVHEDVDDDARIAERVPKSVKRLRACLTCKLVKTYEQFYDSGCDNCVEFAIQGERNAVESYTTAEFAGFISMMEPSTSFAARVNGLGKRVPGCYAIRVFGLPPEAAMDARERD
uniref:Spt4/RpoE2 zinc finger domain-containing protein n=1 Tax=Chromera velia CCMP2878 TaxID=1169474 RepID=A0A0G4G9U6_9ALVE|mmetsp:Transcript_40777/g.80352  ORF Transcript_40777/g.80352 Transcript_40777/m.80352 type:complete len:122 (+) Transcript_40777:159-524(+)|eukprot:Cvel_4403.t1-p1 / transcript=Cvel_4403.t1 / gene=Cvel_4403 / organism=Chromera_velia_CCMP2878 / gene_product=Transcription elongation factor SPT4 homolog 1, putative / transcript_product=Transcription elongation factor SPT4 homolog 1, putative / location=Cvel_scaffold191:82793-84822(+) / protein_length=121 / sequence_SO=supercontig / SO=protein_coding / is_pseudo=false